MWRQLCSDAHRDSVPCRAKLAFSDDWGIRVGGEAWVHQAHEHDQTLSSSVRTGVVLKRRFAIDDQSTFALELGATLTTRRSGIVSSKIDSDINAIFGADRGDWQIDLNLTAIHLEVPNAGAGHLQTVWAAALSRPLNDTLGLRANSGERSKAAPAAHRGFCLLRATA